MRKIILSILSLVIISSPALADALTGGVSTTGLGNKVVDAATQSPVSGATVSLPQKNYRTKTDSNGNFALSADIKGDTVMSVEKEGYRPFSLTINNQIAAKPMVVGIQKSNVTDLLLESAMIHLGDDNFSNDSANAGEFQLKSVGPFYTKVFNLAAHTLTKANYIVIGSIIGIDTALARSLKQNRVRNSYASPPEVYFNGQKIAEIQLNGDNQKIRIPNNLINPDMPNEITIRTGRNLMQTAYLDYDDIEIMNISIQSE